VNHSVDSKTTYWLRLQQMDRAAETPVIGNRRIAPPCAVNEETKKPEEKTFALPPVRRFLSDIAWILLIIWILVMIRSTLTAVDELRKLRISLTTQIAETGVGVTLEAKQIESDLSKLNVTGTVLVDRIDSQLGKARVQIKAAATTATQSATADRVQMEKVLRPAAAAVADMAKEVTDSQKNDGKTPAVVVQPAPVIVQPAPIQPPAAVPESHTHPSARVPSGDTEKTPGVWRRIWRKLQLH
jgi:hypothetical protein